MILPQNKKTKLPPATANRVKVCIVDNGFVDYVNLLSERNLRGVQWELITSGREALRQLQQNDIALWVINLQLADMRGNELCQMIRSQSPSAVIYLLTDDYRPEDERAAWLAGATMFRPKPIDPIWFDRFTQRRVHAEAV